MKINKELSLWRLYLKTIKRHYIYSEIEYTEVVLVVECNTASLKKLSSFG
jgi:hypothetical protein